jgi:putative sigma-54 modulation protein
MEKQTYKMSIVSKNHEASLHVKEYLTTKLAKIEKIAPGIIDIHASLEVHKLDHIIHLSVKFSHFYVQAHASTHDMYQSIDRAVERLQKKLQKWKTQIQEHQVKGPKIVNVPVDVFEKTEGYLDSINDMIEDASVERMEKLFELPKVVKSKTRALKTLTMNEALMKIELSSDNFLLFRSEEDQKLKVLYRRRDQSYGLLQPE